MDESTPVVVGPNLPRLFLILLASNLGIALGLFLACGLGWVTALLCALAAGVSLLLFVLSAARRTPELVITDEGFRCRNVFQNRSYQWADVSGGFEVRRSGLIRMVVFRLTPESRAKTAGWVQQPCPGYDAAITGAYRLPPEELAELLNRHKQRAVTGGPEPPAEPAAGA
jgi:hypothetical protein